MSRTPLVHFNEIESTICKYIMEHDVAYVVGCMAWFSNIPIIKALAAKSGVSIVTCHRNHDVNHSFQYKTLFGRFTPIGAWPRLAEAPPPGGERSLMHHKFILAFALDLSPRWVITGSCNLTQNSVSNTENIIILRDPRVVLEYYEEFRQILSSARNVIM